MNHLGQKIRELRRKMDLTQEKLADYLNISYQSVSKWETGTVTPDLSYIVPLARLFGVSTDELLGFELSAVDAEKEKRKEEYEETWKTGDMEHRLALCKAAVRDYPGDMWWVHQLAMALSMHFWEYEDHERFAAEREEAIRYEALVIENTDDPELRENAVRCIVQDLSDAGRKEEAEKYAALYPEEKMDDIMGYLLDGAEKVSHKRKQLKKYFGLFFGRLNPYDPYELQIMGELIKVVIPDGNYLDYSIWMCKYEIGESRKAVKDGRFDDAIASLSRAKQHTKEYDRIVYDEPGEYRFTSPLFEGVATDTSTYFHSGDSHILPDVMEKLYKTIFDPIRNREDFQALLI